MTPFELLMASTMVLLCVTNMQGFAHHPRLSELPSWYVSIVMLLVLVVVLSLVNAIFFGVFQ